MNKRLTAGLAYAKHLATEKCAICGRPAAESRKRSQVLQWDHCHESGKFRGYLCMSCNVGLGHFHDDPALLLAATRYLLKHQDPGLLSELRSIKMRWPEPSMSAPQMVEMPVLGVLNLGRL